MDKKPRFLIYDRKEVAVLVLLGVMVAVFAFTLGVHLGKRAGVSLKTSPALQGTSPQSLESAQEAVPSDKEIEERVKAKQPAASDLVGQATQEEVAKTDTHLDKPRQTILPEVGPDAPKSGSTGSPKSNPSHSDNEIPEKDAVTQPAVQEKAARYRYSLQVASYPSLLMAQSKTHELEALGFKPVIHKAEVQGIGTRFRVMIGEYHSLAAAEKAGQNYQGGKMIDTFIVAKLPN